MTWIKDQYQKVKGEFDIHYNGCSTGKHIKHGGIAGREESTGLGVYYCIRSLLNNGTFVKKIGMKKGIKGHSFCVQGFGNVGYWAAKFLEKDGGRVTTIIEHDNAIYKKDGFDVEHVKAYIRANNGCLKGYPDAEKNETENPASFLEIPVDYLVPAAVEKSIHMQNAPNITCRAVFEGANGPTTFAAENILLEKGTICVPDLLTNGGGVTCSYFEWLKNLQHVAPGKMTKKFEEQQTKKILELVGVDTSDKSITGASELDIVYSALDEIMTHASIECWDYAQ